VEGVVDDEDVAPQNGAGIVDLAGTKQPRHVDMLVERLFAKIVLSALLPHP
jgi:hypothetical protein